MNGEVVRFGHIDGNEPDSGLHKRRHDGNVAGQPIELSNEEHPPNPPGLFQRSFELGSVPFPGPSFNLSELKGKRQILAPCITQYSSLLSFQTQP